MDEVVYGKREKREERSVGVWVRIKRDAERVWGGGGVVDGRAR